MLAFAILLLAVLSRVLPPLLHVTGANVTMVGAGLLFFGSRLAPGRRFLALVAVAALAATDWWLTVHAYRYPFHLRSYLLTWIWYAAVCLGGSALLWRRRSSLRIGVAAFASATSFFLLSNGAVWLGGNMYPRTAHGLAACYTAALPFYRNDLASTLVFSAAFFALPWAAGVLRDAAHRVAEVNATHG